MTTSEIERLEQAARSVFGHDEGDTMIAEEKQSFGERIRAFILKRIALRTPSLPGV